MKYSYKKTIVFALASIIFPFSLFVSTKDLSNGLLETDNNNPSEKYRSIESPAIRFETEIVSKPAVLDYYSHFEFYYLEDSDLPFLIADALEDDEYTESILEVKLILNPKSFDFAEFSELNYEESVLETIIFKNNSMFKEFYIPSEDKVSFVLSNQKEAKKGSGIYRRLVSSLNMEADFKSSLPQIIPRYTINQSGDVNNQAILDHYMGTLNQPVDQIQLGFGSSAETEIVQSSDDSIINLIPKSIFTANGKYQKGGSEWGYFANTYNDTKSDKITSLFVYDIRNIKIDTINPDILEIRPVLSYNFKYDYDTNTVRKDIPNNYCLGNPKYEAFIKYVSFLDDLNSVEHKNPSEAGYKISEDNGFCFGSNSVKFIGVGKNYNNEVKNIEKVVVLLGDLAVTASTSGMNLASQLAIGAAYNMITDAIINQKNKEYGMSLGDLPGKKVRTTANISGYTSFEDVRKNSGTLPKYFSTQMQDENSSNRTSPLLFKTQTDSISYQFQLYSPHSSTDYTALVSHKFTADVFNDNTWAMHINPDFMSTISTEWSYLFGKDIRARDIIISDGAEDNYVSFGTFNSQKVTFTPQNSGIYDIVMTEMPADTVISLWGNNYGSGRSSYVDTFGNSRRIANEKYVKCYVRLTAGVTYNWEIKRLGDTGNLLFGTARLNVYRSLDPLQSTGGAKYTENHSGKSIQYDGFAVNTQFIPQVDGQYTFALTAPSSSVYKDTYIKLLDANFREIISDDDGWGNLVAGLNINLRAGNAYYIISRFYSSSIESSYSIDVFRQTFIPELRGKVSDKSIWIPYFGNEKNVSFITSQSLSGIVRFQATWSFYPPTGYPSISMAVYDAKLTKIAYQSNLIENELVITMEANTLYLIELATPSSKLTGSGINLYCRRT